MAGIQGVMRKVGVLATRQSPVANRFSQALISGAGRRGNGVKDGLHLQTITKELNLANGLKTEGTITLKGIHNTEEAALVKLKSHENPMNSEGKCNGAGGSSMMVPRGPRGAAMPISGEAVKKNLFNGRKPLNIMIPAEEMFGVRHSSRTSSRNAGMDCDKMNEEDKCKKKCPKPCCPPPNWECPLPPRCCPPLPPPPAMPTVCPAYRGPPPCCPPLRCPPPVCPPHRCPPPCPCPQPACIPCWPKCPSCPPRRPPVKCCPPPPCIPPRCPKVCCPDPRCPPPCPPPPLPPPCYPFYPPCKPPCPPPPCIIPPRVKPSLPRDIKPCIPPPDEPCPPVCCPPRKCETKIEQREDCKWPKD